MSIIETILSAGGGAAVKQIATQFGIGTDQAVSAASVLLPALAGGLQEKIATGKGSEISDLLSSGSLTRFVQSPSSLASPAAVELGNSLVSAIFGPGDPVNTEYRFGAATEGSGVFEFFRNLLSSI